ncbi:MAG: hypothetical protein ABI036_16905 [Fibrobacteria bacterium]
MESDTLKVSIHVANSAYEVNVAEAVFDNINITLAFTGTTGNFFGAVPLKGLQAGERQLRIRVVDEVGDSAVMLQNFRIVSPPELTVELPPFCLISKTLRVRARCVVEYGPCKIDFYRGKPTTSSIRQDIATATNAMDTVVDMSRYGGPGEALLLRVVATDTFGIKSSVFESYGIRDPGPSMKLVDSVPDMILDANTRTILYKDDEFFLYDRVTRVPVRTLPSDSLPITSARLTSVGAVIQHGQLPGIWKEWRGDSLYAWAEEDYSRVKGDFAVWNSGKKLFVRDLRQGLTRLITDSAGGNTNDVDTDGTAVYWSNKNQIIQVSPDGTAKYLGGDATHMGSFPRISSGNVVYRKTDPCCVGYALILHDGGDSETVLRDFGGGISADDYRLQGKWTAFTRLGNTGSTQVWVRDTVGNMVKVYSTLNRPFIENLGSDGSVLINEPAGRTLVSHNGGKLANGLPNMGFTEADGNWFAFSGKYLFQIDTATPVGIRKDWNERGLANLECSRTRGLFQVRVEIPGHYRFELFNLSGRKVIGFDRQISAPGRYSFPLGDGAGPSGLLLLRARFQGSPITTRLLPF